MPHPSWPTSPPDLQGAAGSRPRGPPWLVTWGACLLPDSQRRRNWHSAWSALKPPLGKGTIKDEAPLFLATASPQPRKENSFSGHICSCAAPPRLQIKTPEAPTAPASGQREGAGRSPMRNQHQSTERPFRSTPKLPALTSKPPESRRGEGVSGGGLCLARTGGTHRWSGGCRYAGCR